MRRFFRIISCGWIVLYIAGCCGAKKQTQNDPVKSVHESILENENKKTTPPNRVPPEEKTIEPVSKDSLPPF